MTLNKDSTGDGGRRNSRQSFLQLRHNPTFRRAVTLRNESGVVVTKPSAANTNGLANMTATAANERDIFIIPSFVCERSAVEWHEAFSKTTARFCV